MKNLIIFLATLLAISCSETSSHKSNNPVTAPPDVVDVSDSFKEVYSRGNIVEDIFKKITEADPSLQQLEDKIGNIPEELNAATKEFSEYNFKNTNYYNSAASYSGSINDSSLKNEVNGVIQHSRQRYELLIIKYTNLLASFDKQQFIIDDTHRAMKVILTLKSIEQYQKENLPSIASMQKLSKQLEQLIDEMNARLHK